MAGARLAPAADTIYLALRGAPTPRALAEPFTAHLLACMLAVGIVEAHDNGDTLSNALGLNRNDLNALTSQWAPAASRFFSA